MPTDREPPPLDLDEGERLLARRASYEPHTFNWRCVDADLSDWLSENGPALLARLRYVETELARMKGKENV